MNIHGAAAHDELKRDEFIFRTVQPDLFLCRAPQVIASDVFGWLLRNHFARQRLDFVERVDDGDVCLSEARQYSAGSHQCRQPAAERSSVVRRADRRSAVLRFVVDVRHDILAGFNHAQFNHEIRSGLHA